MSKVKELNELAEKMTGKNPNAKTIGQALDYIEQNYTSGGGSSTDEFRVDIEYGEATGYEYVLKTSWSEIQAFITDVENGTNTRTGVLYVNNLYTSNMFRLVTNGLAFIKFGASGEGSIFGLNVTSYEIKENGIQDFYRLVTTEED